MFRELWYDEVFSYLAIEGTWKNLSYFITEDIHPPLYYVLLKLWAGMFGYGEFGLKSLSVVFFLLTLVVCYLWAKEVTESNLGALMGIFMLAISPFTRAYAFEVRAYSMFAFLFISACYFLHRALIRSPYKADMNWMVFAVALPAMLMTHYITFFILPVFLMFILGFHLIRGKVIESLKNLYVYIGLPCAVIFFMMVPAINYHFNKETNTKWIPEVNMGRFVDSTYAFLFGVDNKAVGMPPLNVITEKIDVHTLSFITYTIVISLIFSAYKKIEKYPFGKDKLFFILGVFMVFVPVLITSYMSSKGINFYLDRYLIGMGTLLLMLIGVSIYNAGRSWIIFVIYAILVMVVKESSWSAGYKDLGMKLEEIRGLVVFDDPFEYSTAKFYMSRDVRNRAFVYDFIYRQDYHNWVSVRAGEALKELPEDGILITRKNRAGELMGTAGNFRIYNLKDF